MKKDFRVYLDDIVESCDMIAEYIDGSNKELFDNDQRLQDAVIRRLEIIGEAVKRLPNEFRIQNPSVEWKGATGMRDVLIHLYDEVDTSQVWTTITEVLPTFHKQVQALLEKS